MSLVACPNCQREITGLGSECPTCGLTVSDVASEPPSGSSESRGYNSDAIAALLLALAALFIWPLAILAVVYGLAALRTLREQKDRCDAAEKGRWMAVTAVIVAAVVVPLVIYGVVLA